MTTNETENFDSTNEEELVDIDTTEEVVEEIDTEDEQDDAQTDLETKLEALEKETLKIQKAKKEQKAQKAESQESPIDGDLTTKDLYALVSAKVAEEDISDITDYAKMKNISVAEAIKTNVIQTILADKSEERKVANATNTGSARRSTAKVSEDVLLNNARSGKMPESDEDLDRLLEARLHRRK